MNYWEKRALENRELTDAIEARSFVRLNNLLKNTLDKINRELEEFDLENTFRRKDIHRRTKWRGKDNLYIVADGTI